MGGQVPVSGLIHSIVPTIPFVKTHVNSGHGDQLITTGSHALFRHSGVMWFALFLLGLLIATRLVLLGQAAPIWLGLRRAKALLAEGICWLQGVSARDAHAFTLAAQHQALPGDHEARSIESAGRLLGPLM